jgi:hypothetical protein
LISAPSPPDCALPFAFFLLLLFFFFLAAKDVPRQPSPMSNRTVERWQQWACNLPDLLIESEALAADMFSISVYNEHVWEIALSLRSIWHLWEVQVGA